MIIKRTKRFSKAFEKYDKKIQLKIIERIELLLDNPSDPKLNIHPLKGELKGIYSFNVTGDFRIWYRKEGNEIILLLSVGTHSQLY